MKNKSGFRDGRSTIIMIMFCLTQLLGKEDIVYLRKHMTFVDLTNSYCSNNQHWETIKELYSSAYYKIKIGAILKKSIPHHERSSTRMLHVSRSFHHLCRFRFHEEESAEEWEYNLKKLLYSCFKPVIIIHDEEIEWRSGVGGGSLKVCADFSFFGVELNHEGKHAGTQYLLRVWSRLSLVSSTSGIFIPAYYKIY